MNTKYCQKAVLKLTHEVFRLGSTAARPKLKGIDGDPHNRWSMRFNLMQRGEPYQDLTCQEYLRNKVVLSFTLNKRT